MKKFMVILIALILAIPCTAFASENVAESPFEVDGECLINNYIIVPSENTSIYINEEIDETLVIYNSGHSMTIDGNDQSIDSIEIYGYGTVEISNSNISNGIYAEGFQESDLNIIIGDDVSITGVYGIYTYMSNLSLTGDNITIDGKLDGILSDGHYYNGSPTDKIYNIDISGDDISITGGSDAIEIDNININVHDADDLYLEGSKYGIERYFCANCNANFDSSHISIKDSEVEINGGIYHYNGSLEIDDSDVNIEAFKTESELSTFINSAVILSSSDYI